MPLVRSNMMHVNIAVTVLAAKQGKQWNILVYFECVQADYAAI